MKSDIDDELSLEKIDDYRGKESKEKRNTVKVVLIICLIVGATFSYIKYNSEVNDYIGTEENPGISTTKK